jgi:signal transduction histidine kinase
LEVPIRARGKWSGLLSAVSSEPLTAEDAAILRGVADALALVDDGAGLPTQAAARALLDAEADLALVAAELEEKVAESIVALRHTDPDKVRAAATASLAEVRRIGRRLRAQALGDGLRAALAALRDSGAIVEAEDAALDGVPPAIAVLVERVAEAACTAAVGKVHIRASAVGTEVKLRVESADNEIELILPAATGTEGRHDDGLDL